MDESYNTSYTFRVPNQLIQTSDLNKKVLLTYIHIHRQRFYEGGAATSLEVLIEESGYSVGQRHSSVSKQFQSALQHLSDQSMILLPQAVKDYSLREHMPIMLLDTFIPTEDYTLVSVKEILLLVESDAGVDKANLTLVYLYIKSKLGKDPKSFWEAQDTIAECTGLSVSTVKRCVQYLKEHNMIRVHNSRKHTQQGDKLRVPNIYVLNIPGWQDEIEKTLEFLRSYYRAYIT